MQFIAIRITEPLKNWRPQGDSNPRYRRERASLRDVLYRFLGAFGRFVDKSYLIYSFWRLST